MISISPIILYQNQACILLDLTQGHHKFEIFSLENVVDCFVVHYHQGVDQELLLLLGRLSDVYVAILLFIVSRHHVCA